MDIQLPVMDGHEATGYIRNCLLSKVPIIAMTAHAWDDEVKKCYASGMNGYVSKPFTLDKLSIEVHRVLSAQESATANPYILTGMNTSVDITMLYEISGDDEDYIALMVQTFLQNMPVTLRKIEESLLSEDWEGVYKTAHFAKSSLSVIKVSNMLEAVLSVEENAKKRINLQTVPQLVKLIKESFEEAEKVLSGKFSSICISVAS
jgi:HPt (histidine-containing phosphotransfer) domain-containing protein